MTNLNNLTPEEINFLQKTVSEYHQFLKDRISELKNKTNFLIDMMNLAEANNMGAMVITPDEEFDNLEDKQQALGEQLEKALEPFKEKLPLVESLDKKLTELKDAIS
jgi:hypothetical protein